MQHDNTSYNKSEDHQTDEKLEGELNKQFNSGLSLIPEEAKKEDVTPSNDSQEKNKNMIDFILHLDSMLIQNKDQENGEESKNQNIDENINNNVVNKNLLGLNESNEKSSVSRESINDTSSRNSQSIKWCEILETKEGWLLKRSYKSPTLIGWQRRYWVLKNQKFLYYKNEDKKKLDGVIDFNMLTCLITVPKEYIDEKFSIGKFRKF